MYIPKHFNIDEPDEIFGFIGENAFGELVSHSQGRLFATHMPFLISDDRQRLIGHVAKANPQHLDIAGQEVLITFQGEHSYISPSWYSSPGVPTWKYQAVHVYGTCEPFYEPERLKEVVGRLTYEYESVMKEPWVPGYNGAMLHAIVGLEVSIQEVQAKFKLGQNRRPEDQEQVANQLEKAGATALAKATRQLL
jgi:transcriptional regulator